MRKVLGLLAAAGLVASLATCTGREPAVTPTATVAPTITGAPAASVGPTPTVVPTPTVAAAAGAAPLHAVPADATQLRGWISGGG